jgi:hypothetical protein
MLVMAPLAQRLMIYWVPEQLVVAFVWLDVVNNTSWNTLTKRKVHHTQRVIRQIPLTVLLPPASVATFGCSYPCITHQ